MDNVNELVEKLFYEHTARAVFDAMEEAIQKRIVKSDEYGLPAMYNFWTLTLKDIERIRKRANKLVDRA